MKKKMIDKEKLKEDLYKVESKIRLKRNEIGDSPEYKLLDTTQNDLLKRKQDMSSKLKRLIKPIYLKYINTFSWWGRYRFKEKDIKSSVKQGIKNGLGITSVAFIFEGGLTRIVKQLIENDLKEHKTEIDKLESEIKEMGIQYDKFQGEKLELMKEGVKLFEEQANKIYNKMNEKEILKKKRIERKQKEVKEQMDNHLPKFMNKITKEVTKRLILEGLN